jgi:hypothetical protein
MPILGIMASSQLSAVGDYESIATVTVGAGGSATIDLTSIPSTYKHLQLRVIAKTSRTSDIIDGMGIRFNSDTGSNYSQHWVEGNGSTASAVGYASQGRGWIGFSGASTANTFSANVVDILDYANTNKYKTIRTLYGIDANGSGRTGLVSSLWLSTSAISSITILPDYNSYVQYSTFALYGIR